MERGGFAVLHAGVRAAPHSHLNPPSSSFSIHRWPLFFSRSQDLLLRSGCATGRTRPRQRQHQQPQPWRDASPFEPPRTCPSLVQRRRMFMNKAVQHCSLRVLSSGGPQEGGRSSEELGKDNLLIDCGPDQECVLGGIVALGKFDALHIGHRQLAIQASKAGTPFLLSFVGMAEVLGWESRPPIVANIDRKRVFSSWTPYCGNITPLEYHVEFSKVRYLTPRQFVERLSMELKVSGVVAGENYRFGYKASGDAVELVRLCKEYGLAVFIVNSVMDKAQRSYNGSSKSINSRDKGQVSSTRVRHALAMGDMEYVTELLGRRHRLVLMLDEQCLYSEQRILAPKSCMLNLPPADGVYNNCTVLVEDKLVGLATVVIGVDGIKIEMNGRSGGPLDPYVGGRLIGIEFH